MIFGHILLKNRSAYILLFYFGHQTLFGAIFQHVKARLYAVRHATQFLATNNVQILPSSSISADQCKPNRTHLGRVGQAC